MRVLLSKSALIHQIHHTYSKARKQDTSTYRWFRIFLLFSRNVRTKSCRRTQSYTLTVFNANLSTVSITQTFSISSAIFVSRASLATESHVICSGAAIRAYENEEVD